MNAALPWFRIPWVFGFAVANLFGWQAVADESAVAFQKPDRLLQTDKRRSGFTSHCPQPTHSCLSGRQGFNGRYWSRPVTRGDHPMPAHRPLLPLR